MLVYISVYVAIINALSAVIVTEVIFTADQLALYSHALKTILLPIKFIKKHFVVDKNTHYAKAIIVSANKRKQKK